MQNYNKFDNVFLDINEEFKRQNSLLALSAGEGQASKKTLASFLGMAAILKGLFLAFFYKIGVLPRFFYSNMCLGWFYDFKKFWVDYLGNRNIDIFDFHFLRNSYRAKFQEVSLDHANENDPTKFLTAWQAQGNIFYLFQSVWNYSKKCFLDCWLFAKYIKKKSYVLEYGCAIAPITQGIIKYFGYKKLRFTIADIPQVSFLYARWKLRDNTQVESILIDPAKKDNLKEQAKYGAIICLTVFEHIVNPLEVAKSFFEHLEKNGVLIFDYIKGEANGLDSKQSMQERNSVLEFIEKNFKILKGKINFQNSMGLTIVQKI
ncbi:MAG: methyltransferase domain-containing protein [Candidatus Pacebacteria bacterium]|nr:methyltransferase domain-containing protein [Candidatus Paceibacterota bacterium]